MKLISWNVNGLRAVCDKGGFRETFAALDADFFCLQETKMQAGQLDLQFEGYGSSICSSRDTHPTGTTPTGKDIPGLPSSPGTNPCP